MKKFLLLSATAAFVAAASAAPVQLAKASKAAPKAEMAVGKAAPKAKNVKQLAPGVSVTIKDGHKQLVNTNGTNRIAVKENVALANFRKSASAKKAAKRDADLPSGASFFESFEGWDGETLPWLPDGWTTKTADAELFADASWQITEGLPAYGFEVPDGNYMMGIYLDMDLLGNQYDEWLVTPEVAVAENEVLSFWSYSSPLFLFSLDNVDWDTSEFIGEKELAYNLEVLVQEGDGEWQTIWTAADDYMDATLEDLFYAPSYIMVQNTVGLADYVGKNIKIAFRLVGDDIDNAFVDGVKIGFPELDGVYYDNPISTLYWGYDRSEQWGCLNMDIAMMPVYAPTVWENMSYADATYGWVYNDPETTEWVYDDSQDALSVTYVPDYTSASSIRNNLFYFPHLLAAAPGAADADYTAPYAFFQAGGKSEYLFSDGMFECGLLPFAHNWDGFGFTAINCYDGYDPVPVFGYNNRTDNYWLNYTMNGEEPSENDDVYVSSILNYVFPSTAPIVVKGASVLGLGIIDGNAKFTLDIIPLDEEFVPQLDSPLATAVCTGDDVLYESFDGERDLLNIIFDFDAPVALDPSATGYIVRFSGFHDPANIDYFVPAQSMLPFQHGYAIGWTEKQIRVDSDEYRTSYSPMYYVEGAYGICHNAFAIQLDAEYPWLVGEEEEITLAADGTPVAVDLESYYDAADLTIEAPAGVTATIEGRYDDTVLTVSHDDSDVVAEGTLTVTGPGVSKSYVINDATAGIRNISAAAVAANSNIVALYTITGQRVNAADAPAGLYVARYANGTTGKLAIR